jgi:uncharacterized membrane protein SpoIIM required for sporulation
MVLESMINPKNAEDKPWHVFIIAIVYTFIAVFFAYYLFPSEVSMLSVALVTIIFVPFFQRLFSIEEKKEDLAASRRLRGNLWQRHAKLIYVFSAFFLGVIVAMSFVFIFFGSDLFSLQSQTINSFSSGAAVGDGNFSRFFVNNTQVMVIVYILSLLFGAGSVFILSWNASVIAVYVGMFSKSLISQGYGIQAAYIFGVPAGLGSIALHGVPEVLAYFVAGLAGGILSVGLIREKLGSRNFQLIVKDSLKLFVIAEVLIFIAALIEAL